MSESSEYPPESERFDEFVEVAVDDNEVLRVEMDSELKLSAVDAAIIAGFLEDICEDIDEDLQDEYGKGVDDILREDTDNIKVSRYTEELSEWKEVSWPQWRVVALVNGARWGKIFISNFTLYILIWLRYTRRWQPMLSITDLHSEDCV